MIRTLMACVMLCSLLACGGAEVEPDETAVSPPDSGAVTDTTDSTAPDGLDCADDSRAMSTMMPPEGFTGYESPEAAAAAIADSLPVETTPTLRDDVWYMVTSDGRSVALTSVEEFGDGWWAGEYSACGDLE